MKKRAVAWLLGSILLFSGCVADDNRGQANCVHIDDKEDGVCDDCGEDIVVTFDIYAVNDLHGKFSDSDEQIGVDEFSTYIKNARAENENTILLSSGDMWQGSSESNLTQGALITDWMNELDFAAMTLGNHEYDWGEESIETNAAQAEFPFLAINVYEKATNERVDYCKSSVMVEKNGAKVGIIGAVGDCYSSIAGEQVKDVYFKTGRELTALVKGESEKLRSEGADLIIYSLHDGYGSSASSVKTLSDAQFSSYYDVSLSEGYVDVVFEGHTHCRYVVRDSKGVYHLQGGGDNDGITHAEITVDCAKQRVRVLDTEYVNASAYAHLSDDPIVQNLLEKYRNEISLSEKYLGENRAYRSSDFLRQTVANLYYQAGVEKWGASYDIVLGGGYISVRSPYVLQAGSVTYGDLYSIFPFDNALVLCSVSGYYLKTKFFETQNSNYYLGYGAYGAQVRDNINENATYYIIADTYSSAYAPNHLTEIARYDSATFARDLLAVYIETGGFA